MGCYKLWDVINHNNILSLLGSLIPFGELREGRRLLQVLVQAPQHHLIQQKRTRKTGNGSEISFIILLLCQITDQLLSDNTRRFCCQGDLISENPDLFPGDYISMLQPRRKKKILSAYIYFNLCTHL